MFFFVVFFFWLFNNYLFVVYNIRVVVSRILDINKRNSHKSVLSTRNSAVEYNTKDKNIHLIVLSHTRLSRTTLLML
jgi:hypothetical protein